MQGLIPLKLSLKNDLAIESYQGTPQVMTALKLIPLVFTRPSELWGMEWQK